MAHLQRDELRALARASRIMIAPAAEEKILHTIDDVLTYVAILGQAGAEQVDGDQLVGMRSVLRPDVVRVTDAKPIMAEAPRQESGYFVVPVIVSHDATKQEGA